ncbi:MAG TPA: DEAD/DEAH box helicase [Limnochordales bacterium]
MSRRQPRVPHVFRGCVLDEFQIQAAIAIQQEMSTLVSAPTGTGKSLIADYLVDAMLHQGRRVIYTAPLKALVNQKYREFRELYGGAKVGILTGDLSLNPAAPVVVMTTEVLRNRLLNAASRRWDEPGGEAWDASDLALGAEDTGEAAPGGVRVQPDQARDAGIDVDWVVFDEFHYIDHPHRGTVWEEAMLLLPPGCRILGLSATVPNIAELAAWLEAVLGEPVATVVHTERAVPLRHRYFTAAGQLVDYGALWQHLTGHDLKAGTLSVDEAPLPRRAPLPRERRTGVRRDAVHMELVALLQREGLFPAIYFVLSRREAERMARELARRRGFLKPHEREAVRVTVRHILHQVGLPPSAVPGLDDMAELWSRGIGVHHAGLLPIVKHIVEHLLERRILRLVYATETFAVGVNMPVRTVCFDSLQKFDGQQYRLLTQQEYMQMAGRAGRRGLDREGTVICLADPDTFLKAGLRDWETEALEPLTSRFALSYTTVLNLMCRWVGLPSDDETGNAGASGPGVAEPGVTDPAGTGPPRPSRPVVPRPVRRWLGRSLKCFQAADRGLAAAALAEEFAERASVLARLGYLDDGKLTAKGEFCRRIWVKELLVTELAFDGTLASLAPDALAGWAAAVVWEPRPQDASLPRSAPGWLAAAQLAADRIVRQAGAPVQASLRVEARIAPVVQRWAAGEDWQEVLRSYPLEPGDFVALCRQAVDLLRQVAAAAATALRALEAHGSESLSALRETAYQAVAAVERDIVRASRLF